jgi:tetratricopeptide (TPR) repeat protein
MIDAIARGRTQANGLEDYIDWSAMLDRAYQGLNVPAASKAAFLRGFMTSAKGKNGLSVQIQANLQNGGSYVITRVLDRPEGTRLRLRLLQPAGGVNFHEFLLRESSDGLRAVDLRIAATGEDMSETFRRLEVLSQAQQSRSFLDRLSGKDVAFVKHWSQIERMIQSNQQSNFDETLQIASTLPLEVRNEKFCLLQELVASIQGGGPDALVEVIDRYRSAHPNDPALEIFSIDYYAAKGDLKQAIESAQKLNNSLEGDGHMLSLIADLQWQTGLLKEARQTIEQAIQLEPNLEDSHWTKVTITAAQQDHAATRDSLKELMATFQVSLDLSAFESDKTFKTFLASPECAELKTLIESRSTAP